VRRKEELTVNTMHDFAHTFDPSVHGAENMLRFFTAVQYEAIGENIKPNHEALKDFVRGGGGDVFLKNIYGQHHIEKPSV
jgi:hypothetical protein